jgi:hypothetical protein
MDEPATPRVGAGHVVLCGLNELGYRTLEELSRMGAEVVVVVRAAHADLATGVRALGAIGPRWDPQLAQARSRTASTWSGVADRSCGQTSSAAISENASTTAGSNSVPAPRRSSATASETVSWAA